MNNSNNIFQKKRILLAVVISFLFFVVYDYFFIPKQQIKLEQNITTTQADSQNATNINAPQQNPQANLNVAATSNTIPQDKIIADIKSEHFEAQIDSLGRIVNFYLQDKKYQN